MIIVIPMAGLSQRFIDAGYSLPKYMLYVGTRSLFNISVSSFENYFFKATKFLFIARNIYDTKLFIEKECKIVGLNNYEIVVLDKPTKGQAETVYLGLQASKIKNETKILVFNIDTIRKGFVFPKNMAKYDGYIEVFNGSGKNWSYVEPFDNKSDRVKRTAEKEEISDLCSTGLYYFKTKLDYCDSFEKNCSFINGEIYIAPLYNKMIQDGKIIYFHKIKKKEVVFSGIPSEYEKLLKSEL